MRHRHSPARAVASELSAALCWTPFRADSRTVLALELVRELPGTLAALTGGVIDLDRAAVIAGGIRVLVDPLTRRQVEARVLAKAGGQTVRQVRRRVEALVLAADPGAAGRRRERGRRDRRVERPHPGGYADGIADMYLSGPVEDLVALWTAVDAAARARRGAGDPRTLDQLRFDVLTGLGWTGLGLGHLGCCAPGCANDHDHDHDYGHVTHPADTADGAGGEGDDEQAAAGGVDGDGADDVPAETGDPATHAGPAGWPVGPDPGGADPPDPPDGADPPGPGGSDPGGGPDPGGGGGGLPVVYRLGGQHGRAATVNVTIAVTTVLGLDDQPAELEGYGPIPADAGRVITADATLRRLLTDPRDGRLLEYGRSTYPPPQPLADLIIARDRTCRFPTCDTPARSCDIDHRHPWSAGGTTGEANNQALARRFHIDKTLHGWRLDQPEPGVFTWTSPAGRSYRVDPETIGLIYDTTPPPATGHPDTSKPAQTGDPNIDDPPPF
ncbi:MAG TPA: DUF222 domain-containing protein [Jiangellaceae bacterium]|nr:DUF222 domain-containing protein [Jiangellaceae bacterium]